VSGVELGVQRCQLERKKIDKCPTVELGVSTTHLKKRERKEIAHVLPKQRSKKRRDSNMRSNEKSVLSSLIHFYHHYHLLHHTCTS